MSFLAILEVLNFDFSKFEQLSRPKFTKIKSSESLKLPKMTFFDRLNLPKFDLKQNRSGGKIIKFQQSQAITSHFERFWSIVHTRHGTFWQILLCYWVGNTDRKTLYFVYAMCKSKTCNCCTKVTFEDWYTFVGSRFFVLFFVVLKVRLLTPSATFVYIQVSYWRAIIGVFITIVITSLLYNKLSNNFSKVMPLKTKKIWAGRWRCCHRPTIML